MTGRDRDSARMMGRTTCFHQEEKFRDSIGIMVTWKLDHVMRGDLVYNYPHVVASFPVLVFVSPLIIFGLTKPDIQDYREINKVMIKNQYPLPIIQEIMDKLKDAVIFTKMDVRKGYNNI